MEPGRESSLDSSRLVAKTAARQAAEQGVPMSVLVLVPSLVLGLEPELEPLEAEREVRVKPNNFIILVGKILFRKIQDTNR